MGVVYVLKPASSGYYYGSTNELDRRLEQHSRGRTMDVNWIRQIARLGFGSQTRTNFQEMAKSETRSRVAGE